MSRRPSSMRASTQLYLSLWWLALSVTVMVLTWFLHARANGGVKHALRHYGVVLPRISMTGATMPAYVVFSVGVPLGVIAAWRPYMKFLERLRRLAAHVGSLAQAHDPGLFEADCHCFWCCCCCCCDPRRVALGGSADVAVDAGAPFAVPPRCTCVPHFPYVVKALAPLARAVLLGLAELAVISLAWHTGGVYWGAPLHFAGAFVFLHGSEWLAGCIVYVQWRMAQGRPMRLREMQRLAQVDAGSLFDGPPPTSRSTTAQEEEEGAGGGAVASKEEEEEEQQQQQQQQQRQQPKKKKKKMTTTQKGRKLTRWKLQLGLFLAMLFVTFVSDLLTWIIGLALSVRAGEPSDLSNFHNRYWGAINQWALVALIFCFNLTVAHHLACWDREEERWGPEVESWGDTETRQSQHPSRDSGGGGGEGEEGSDVVSGGDVELALAAEGEPGTTDESLL